MEEHPTLKNPPITEGLIDIQVTLSPEIDLAKLATLQKLVSNKYPRKEERQTGRFQFKTEAGQAPAFSFGIDGYLFFSDTEKKVWQARLDGFTFSKLKPYSQWSEFKAEGEYLWGLYSQVAKPIKITRIAVKYTNRIELPTPADYKVYFKTTPEIPNTLPQLLSNYYMRLVMPYRDTGATAVVTQTVDYSNAMEAPDILPLIFDIDVFEEVDMKPNDDTIWQILEKLRSIKNEIFFESITEETRRLFS